MAQPKSCGQSKSLVGVSLLAIAVYQSALMLNDTPLSRAGSLLQLFWGAFKISFSHRIPNPA
ncbi:hypothetical protein C1893_26490 [Pseudomonas sp. MPR-ANC1]|nr:hypothetical protein C1893_26490 [Pseudomonas sp. MPR-ANC1]